MARIGIHILTKASSYDDTLPYQTRKRYKCRFCSFEGACTLSDNVDYCPNEWSYDKSILENCNIAGHDFDEVCNMLAMQEPSGVKEILLELAGIKDFKNFLRRIENER